MPMEFLQGTVLERTSRLEIGSGLLLTQDANGVPTLDYNPTSGLTQAQGDARYVLKAGDTVSGNLDVVGTLTKGGVAVSLAGHTHAFSELTTKPTTLGGYGITDALSAPFSQYSVADAQLSSNIARLNTAQTWGAIQTLLMDGVGLKHQAAAVGAAIYHTWHNSAGTRRGYLGFGSTNSSIFYIHNEEAGDVYLYAHNTLRTVFGSAGGTLYDAWTVTGNLTGSAKLTANRMVAPVGIDLWAT